MTLEVTWRNGKQSVIREVKPNRIYEIDEAGAVPGESQPVVAVEPTFFKDVSPMIATGITKSFMMTMRGSRCCPGS